MVAFIIALLIVLVALMVVSVRAPKWSSEHLLAPVVTGIVGGTVVAVLGLFFVPNVAERLALGNPTCEDPRGAIGIDTDTVQVTGTPADENSASGELANIADGNIQSTWVPVEEVVTDGEAYATFKFDEPTDLALVCVVNGYQLSGIGYLRDDRARVIDVQTKANKPSRATILASAGEADIANPQIVRIHKGETAEVTLRIRNTYPGQRVYDPAEDAWQDPTGRTAIAEVMFFRRDPAVGRWWEFWQSPDS